jgi:uncharacterized protein (TIGR03000 family)
MVSKVVKLGLCMATLAALWIATPEAQAQRRGGRGGGGWSSGGWGSPGVYIGPGGVGVDYGRDGYYRDGSYYRDGYYRDGWYGDRGGYWSNGRWYGPSRSYYYDSYPRYVESYDVAPTQTYQTETVVQESASNNARIRVRVPDPNAEVLFNGSPTEQRGMDRLFETPPLENSNKHSYEIKARWRDENGQMMEKSRTVYLQRGKESLVDFTQERQTGAQQEQIRSAPNNRKQQELNRPDEQTPPPQK